MPCRLISTHLNSPWFFSSSLQGTLLHVRRDLSAEACKSFIDLPCTVERRRDMRQDIRLPDMLSELR